MDEQLDGRPVAGEQASEPEGDERAQAEQAPEDRAGNVRDLDVALAGAGPARSAEGSAAVAAGVAIEVEADRGSRRARTGASRPWE